MLFFDQDRLAQGNARPVVSHWTQT